MHIFKPCCDNIFQAMKIAGVQVVDKVLYIGDEQVNFCPWCGTKVSLEKVQEDEGL